FFNVEDFETILHDGGLDNTIPITFNDFDYDFEGINLKIDDITNDDFKQNTCEAEVIIAIRFKEDYKKARDICNTIGKLLQYGEVKAPQFNDYKVNYVYWTNNLY